MRALRWVVGQRRATALALAIAAVLGATAAAGAAVLGSSGSAGALAASCGTDEFDGTTLDDVRWDVLRPFPAGLSVAGGKLNLEMTNTDLIAGTASAQNLVLQDAPAGGWTATTKLNIATIDANGEQAGLALWKSEGPPNANNVFGKVTFIQTNNGTRQFEAIWTDGGGVAYPIGNSGAPLPAGVPANADLLIRLRSDAVTVTAEYSIDDGANWTPIGGAFRVGGPLRVGLLALRGGTGAGVVPFERFDLTCGPDVSAAANTNRGVAPLTVDFDGTVAAGAQNATWDFGDGATAPGTDVQHAYTEPGTYRATLSAEANGNVTRASTVVTVLATDPPCPATADEFSGNALDPKWQVLRPRLTGLNVAGGNLRLTAYGGDMSGGTASARNVLLQPAPAGPWTATTKIDTALLTATGDQAGLLVWRSEAPNHFAKVVYNRRNANEYWVERSNTRNGSTGFTGNGNGNSGLRPVPAASYLRITSDGAANPSLQALYSEDGAAWTPLQAAFQVEGSGPLRFGLAYFSGDALRVAQFDYFRIEGPSACDAADTVAPVTVHTTSPAAASPSGWFTAAPQVTLTGVDDAAGSGVATTEYRIDGGAFTPYTAPFTVPTGEHTIDYRSTDRAANVEATKSFSVKVDPAAPTTTAALDPAQPGPGGTYDGPVEVSLSATDGTGGSGVEATQYRVDGGPWTDYTDPAEQVLFDGTQASLNAWSQAGPGSFVLQPDGSIETTGGLGMLWYPVKQFGNFSLKFQFRDAQTGAGFSNGGAFVRFPHPNETLALPAPQRPPCVSATESRPEWVAIFCGHEIQVYDGTTGEAQKTGSIYNFQPLNITQARPVTKGDWNDYEIRVVGQQYTIIRNGEVINRFDNSIDRDSSRAGDPPTQLRRFATGYIGLQNHGTADRVQYRAIRVSELPGAASGPFTISENGSHTVDYRSRDVAGNLEPAKSVAFSIGEPEPVNIFDTIGITEGANRGNSQIFGDPDNYSLPADEMPPSRQVVVPPNDATDDVPVRMPNTSGTVPNLAAFHGQTVILREQEQKAYTKVHLFGTTTDGGPAGGDFVLTFSDATTQTATVRFRDWCDQGDPTPEHHVAIGPLTKRYTENGQDGAPCAIYHVPVTITDPSKTLVSVKLPSTTTPGNPPIQGYLMALTLEQAGGAFATPDLGASAFPDDLTPPVSSHVLAPATPANGWYTAASVDVTLASSDEAGGSGLDELQYRIDGGAFQPYTAAFTITTEGNHLVEYRGSDNAGNTETPKSVAVRIDRTVPTSSAELDPAEPAASGWYDGAVELTLRGRDGGNGSGIGKLEYHLGDGVWKPYTAPVMLPAAGTFTVSHRSTDVAGNLGAAVTEAPVKIDGAAPTTVATLASDPAGSGGVYRGPVQVSLASADGAGSGVASTQYRVDGGAFQAYGGPFTLSALGGHLVEFRATDNAGNLENLKEVAFAIAAPQAGGNQPPVEPFVAISPLGRLSVSSFVKDGLQVSATCVAVGRGTLKLGVTKKVARRLGLRNATLASRSVRCGDALKVDAELNPSSAVKRALKKATGQFTATLSLKMSGATGSDTDTEQLVLRGKRQRR